MTTIEGLADSAYLDRLAEIVYDEKAIVDPLIGLNDDGSVEIDFCFRATDARHAVEGVDVVLAAIRAAKPLRDMSEVVESLRIGQAEPEKRPVTA